MKAKFDLDQFRESQRLLAEAKPWDVSLTIDGKEYRLRRFTSADMKQLAGVVGKSEAEGRAIILGLFDGDAPSIEEWDQERHLDLISFITGIYQEMLKKRTAAATAAVAIQMKHSGS